MAKKFRDLVNATMTSEQRVRMAARSRELLAAMPLAELRQAREMTQATLAELLETSQPEVSKIEKRTDMYLSTLRRYVEAMGGHLEIVVHFPNSDPIRINQFQDAETSARRSTPA